MKLESQHSPTISNSSSISTMGIAVGAEAQISRMLRDQVYSDKILAVVREYVCNAHDEHVKHGIKKPVVVSVTEKTFSVRDFAKGLSDDDVRNVFGKYGASTKQNTNKLIGGFGIGSKAGHAYADTFIITSYFEGVKTTYACVLGGTGAVQIGEIHELAKEKTNETGIEISIEIKQGNGDSSRFSVTTENFCMFCNFNIEYYINGVKKETAKILKSEKVGNCEVRIVEIPKNTNNIYSYTQRSHILMGGVIYKKSFIIHTNRMKHNKAILFDFEVGELSVSLSRETFESNEALKRVENLVTKWVEDQKSKDLESLRNVKFEDYIKDDFMGIGLGEYQMHQGEVFQFDTRTVFKTWASFKDKLKWVHYGEEPKKDKDGKFPIILLPDVRDTGYWETKVRNFLTEKDNRYMVRSEVFYNLSEEDRDLFNTKGAKTLKYPKSSRGSKYKLHKGFKDLGYHNDIEAFNVIFGTEFDDEQECRDYAEDFYNNTDFKSVEHIKKYIITSVQCCDTLRNKIKQLGVLTLHCDVIKKKVDEINKIREEREKRDALKQSYFRNTALSGNNRIKEIFDKYPLTKLEKLVESTLKIRKNNNLRNKIIGGNTYGTKYNRSELRKILNFTK